MGFMIIDSHCHVYPKNSEMIYLAKDVMPFDVKKTIEVISTIENTTQNIKPIYRTAMRPYLKLLHLIQTNTRNVDDLLVHVQRNLIKHSILIAHPPLHTQ